MGGAGENYEADDDFGDLKEVRALMYEKPPPDLSFRKTTASTRVGLVGSWRPPNPHSFAETEQTDALLALRQDPTGSI